jgi:hypothetical protein
MNDRDVLKRASEELRDSTEPTSAELAALRARVLSNKVRTLAPRARSKSLRWLLPLAAALVTGSALAATPGAWQGLVDAVERYLPVELLSPAREAVHPARKRANKPPPLPAAPPAPALNATEPALLEPSAQPAPAQAETSAASEAPAAVVAPAAARKAAAERTPAARPAPSARNEQPAAPSPAEPAAAEAAPEPEPAPKSASSAELMLYRPAHELHFRARDFGAALVAWDAYLSRFPHGTLALEAEYNRALCLMRLGRYAEARTALAPFAAGARGGGYRRSEATRFLQAMEKVP